MENLKDVYPKTSNVNDLRFEHNGKVYLLHHSHTDLQIGDKIRASGSISGLQVTAGDAAAGFSYGWDVADIQAVKDAAKNQAKAHTVYLTTANLEDTLPDINLSGTSARAVKGDMPILDKVTIPTNVEFGGRDARAMIYEMIDRHGIKLGTAEEGKLVNVAYIVAKGEEAKSAYTTGRAEMRALTLRDTIERHAKAVESGETPLPRVPYSPAYFEEMKEIYKLEGVEGLKQRALENIKNSPIFPSNPGDLQNILERTNAEDFAGMHITQIPRETLEKGVLRGSISQGIPMELMETPMERVTRNVEVSRMARASSKFKSFLEDSIAKSGKVSNSTLERIFDSGLTAMNVVKNRIV